MIGFKKIKQIRGVGVCVEVRGFVFVFVCTRKMYNNLSLSLSLALQVGEKQYVYALLRAFA